MSEILDTVLLLALPASGKSEVRKYLDGLAPAACAGDFHMGPTVQLDDFPYVHMMRQTDEALRSLGKSALFFHAADKPFQDPRDWGTLIELVNEDHADMLAKRVAEPQSAADLLLSRIDAARRKIGAPALLGALPAEVRSKVCAKLEAEARAMLEEKHANYPDTLSGRTLVIEFARGGAHGSSMPLAAPYGYAYSLSRLSDAILERAAVLYIWVTPEESRRKNDARADPNDPGSILHHGVPIDVMMGDYGCDDMDYLIQKSDRPDTLKVAARGKSYRLPVARFDNRVDKTSFVRNDRPRWRPEEVRALHEGLAEALTRLHASARALAAVKS